MPRKVKLATSLLASYLNDARPICSDDHDMTKGWRKAVEAVAALVNEAGGDREAFLILAGARRHGSEV